mmetsp:Transcript_6843/g.16797  ORF Transcript_6843/g.16797 Transcript_6843/m.16797 type:complete len:252 (+) Transcript_6843:815-1570(+)
MPGDVSIHEGSRDRHGGWEDTRLDRLQDRPANELPRIGVDPGHRRSGPLLSRKDPRVHPAGRHLPGMDGRLAALPPGGFPRRGSPRNGAGLLRRRKVPVAVPRAQPAPRLPAQVRGGLRRPVSQRRRRQGPGQDDLEVSVDRKRADLVPGPVVQPGRHERLARLSLAPHDAGLRDSDFRTLRVAVSGAGCDGEKTKRSVTKKGALPRRFEPARQYHLYAPSHFKRWLGEKEILTLYKSTYGVGNTCPGQHR